MPTENEALFHRLFDDVLACRQDSDRRAANARELYAKECTVHDPTNGFDGDVVNGPQMVVDVCRVYDLAFPDSVFRVLTTFDGGDTVSAVWQVSGTHTGPFLGTEPKGKPFDIVGMSVVRFVDRKVTEIWQLTDNQCLMEQIGGMDPGLRAGDMVPGRIT